MPFQFYCSKCGALLLEVGGEILRYHTSRNACKKNQNQPPIEAFIIRKIGKNCPQCGHRLSTKPIKIEVYPIQKRQQR